MILQIGRRHNYTEYFLVEVPDGMKGEFDEETLSHFIKEEEPQPYLTDSETTDGDINWSSISEEKAQEYEQVTGIKRHILAAQEHDVHYVHTGKFEALYRVWATSQEKANEYVMEHHLELEPMKVIPLSDDYERYL